ncbi:hypothetical protein [Demequina globuliformis]|uniref:hypothetical protein n=1 Tax=Demequina globuliformis TaxID=676202 RepID=UPI0007842DA0|nr:hypothetical protein [Demequina globuliformis]
MITTTAPRRRAGQRLSSAIWGLLVIGSGALMILTFSGYAVDLELLGIILLASLGGWLMLSAALSGLGRKREIREATAPVVEEPHDDAHAGTAPDADDALDRTASPDADALATPNGPESTGAAGPADPTDPADPTGPADPTDPSDPEPRS